MTEEEMLSAIIQDDYETCKNDSKFLHELIVDYWEGCICPSKTTLEEMIEYRYLNEKE